MVSGLSLKIVMIIVYRLLQVSNETPPTCIYIYIYINCIVHAKGRCLACGKLLPWPGLRGGKQSVLHRYFFQQVPKLPSGGRLWPPEHAEYK